MKHFLLKFEGNWSDEMDVYGFAILTEAHWNYKKLEAQHVEYPIEIGCGTNEDIIFESFKHYLSHFEVHEISDDEIKCLKKFFPDTVNYGFVAWLEGYVDDSFYKKHGYCPD